MYKSLTIFRMAQITESQNYSVSKNSYTFYSKVVDIVDFMSIIQKSLSVALLGVIVVICAGMVIYFTRDESYVGTIDQIDCAQAGAGCTPYVLAADNGNIYSLDGSDIKFDQYTDKKVTITGSLTSGEGSKKLNVESVKFNQ